MGPLVADRVFIVCGHVPDPGRFGPALLGVLSEAAPPNVFRTSLPWLLVAGAAAGRQVNAEAARREGRAAAALVAGSVVRVPYDAVPTTVVGPGGGGWAGFAEAECRRRGHSVLVGRAKIAGRGPVPPGFVKVVADAGSQRLLGVHVAGPLGCEAVVVGAALFELGASRLDLAAMAFPLGSPAQALAEAAATATAP